MKPEKRKQKKGSSTAFNTEKENGFIFNAFLHILILSDVYTRLALVFFFVCFGFFAGLFVSFLDFTL